MFSPRFAKERRIDDFLGNFKSNDNFNLLSDFSPELATLLSVSLFLPSLLEIHPRLCIICPF